MAKGFIKSNEVIYKDENGIERKRTISKEFTQKVDQDKFYMTFIDYVKWIYGLTTITTLKVLYKLLEIAEYNTGELSLSPGKRQEIMEEIGIKKSAFTQALNQLVESGALEVKYKTDKTRKTVETYVHDIPNEHLIQFVSFIDNTITSDKQLDYIYKLQQILDICVTNKGKRNKYK